MLASAARAAAFRLVIAASAGLALAGAAGCAPTVSLVRTDVRGATAQGVSVDAVLAIENGNGFDVTVRRVRAEVLVAGKYRLSPVDAKLDKTIPAGRKVRVSVPVIVPWAMVPGLYAEGSSSASVSYHMTGTADVTASRSVRVDGYPIDQDGIIPRSAFNATAPIPGLGGAKPGGFQVPW